MYSLLNRVNAPQDLRGLNLQELEQLCREIRKFLIDSVSKTGGHLSSNLGVVELTVALHRIFRSPIDMLVFDVGHQCYTHKILTGRRDDFQTLRQAKGLSGFPSPKESPHDIFIAGHGSTSLSVAVGLARAKKIKNERGFVIAIVGDGAFTGGMIYEAINNIESLDNLIVVLNDNKMSISKNDGSVGKYLTQLRASAEYNRAKNDIKTILGKTPIVGQSMVKGIQAVKSTLRRSIYHSTFFEEMGFEYMGLANGHSLGLLCNLFSSIKKGGTKRPVLVHIETQKGKGYAPAEQNPAAFHGVSAFNAYAVSDPDVSPSDSFSNIFGQNLANEGSENKNICAITAAMKYGTGLQYFKHQHNARFFDVGMAEGHAVTFGAGLARGGMVPVVSIYSTFLQRSYDQIIHDVVLQNLNLLFAIDRAGFVPGDGATHQGIYDAAFLSQQKTMAIVSPCNYAELIYWLHKLLTKFKQPRALRYPRGSESNFLNTKKCTGDDFDCVFSIKKAKTAIVSYGAEIENAWQAAKAASEQGFLTNAYQMVVINPISANFVHQLQKYEYIIFAEEGILQGGIGEHLASQLYNAGFKGKFIHKGIDSPMIDHANIDELKKNFGLDTESLVDLILKTNEAHSPQ